MDFINKYLQQIQQLVLAMSVQARVTSALLLIAIVIGLFYLARYNLTGGESYLYGGRDFSQSELGAMEEALGKAGLNEYEIVGNRIKVPRNERDLYLRGIAENGATPRMAHEFDELESSFNPFMSKEEQRNLEKARMQRKITSMITSMEGIQQCAVQFSENELPGFPRRIERSAAIMVKPTGTRGLNATEAQAIINIADGAVAGLKDTDITVVDQNTGETFSRDEDEMGLLPQNNALTQATRYWEEWYRKIITERLRAYEPNVQVLVEVDPTLFEKGVEKVLDSTPTILQTENETASSRSTTGASGGTPGVLPNNPQAGANQAAAVSASQPKESTDETSRESSSSAVGGTISQTEKAGLEVKSVKVSIGIPRSFYEEQWLRDNPPADGEPPEPMPDTYLQDEELKMRKKIQDIIHVLLPQPTNPGEDLLKYIVVETDPVEKLVQLDEPGATDHALAWLGRNWQTIGMLMVGVFGLVMLRGMIKSNAPDPVQAPDAEEEQESSAEGALATVGGIGDEDDEDAPENKLMKRFGTSGRSLKSELSELVEKDIDAAANVLKSWIGDVA